MCLTGAYWVLRHEIEGERAPLGWAGGVEKGKAGSSAENSREGQGAANKEVGKDGAREGRADH